MITPGAIKEGDKVCCRRNPSLPMRVQSFDDFQEKAFCTWERDKQSVWDTFYYNELDHYYVRVKDGAVRPLKQPKQGC